jgi:hypothetical protein
MLDSNEDWDNISIVDSSAVASNSSVTRSYVSDDAATTGSTLGEPQLLIAAEVSETVNNIVDDVNKSNDVLDTIITTALSKIREAFVPTVVSESETTEDEEEEDDFYEEYLLSQGRVETLKKICASQSKKIIELHKQIAVFEMQQKETPQLLMRLEELENRIKTMEEKARPSRTPKETTTVTTFTIPIRIRDPVGSYINRKLCLMDEAFKQWYLQLYPFKRFGYHLTEQEYYRVAEMPRGHGVWEPNHARAFRALLLDKLKIEKDYDEARSIGEIIAYMRMKMKDSPALNADPKPSDDSIREYLESKTIDTDIMHIMMNIIQAF